MLRHLIVSLCLVSIFVLATGCTSPSRESGLSSRPVTAAADRLDETSADFLHNAIRARRLGILLAREAVRRGTTERVREYAANSIPQQELILDRLADLASRYQVTIPAGVGDGARGKVNDLRERPREEFDRTFLDLVAENRSDAVLAAEFASEQANADVRTFGEAFRQTFQEQLDEVRAMQDGEP